MSKSTFPNIVIIYADDLGFGDIGCYGGTGVPTPNLDRMAQRGLRFTNAYATAATCTPSRYSILTGSYPWRNPDAQILPGDAPMIIERDQPTLPRMLQQAGYTTAAMGKWHLGLGDGNIDWNRQISPCVNDAGFDYSFTMAATNDRVPCVYIEDGKVVGLDPSDPIEVTYDESKPFPGVPTGKTHPHLLRMHPSHGHDMAIVNGISRIGYMRGGMSALWKDEEMAEVFLEKAISFITSNRQKPFFLYYDLHQPHVPRVPGPRFAGKTGLGPRGDVIAELDWCVGQVLDTLDRLGIADSTMIIFSSDNGPVLDDGYQDRAVELTGNHRPAGDLRGGKYSLYDGGTRIPFLLSWQGKVAPGTSDALVCQVDLYASIAQLIGAELPDTAAPDSENLLPAFIGQSAIGRTELITEGIGTRTAFHRESWVLIPPYHGPAISPTTGIELGNSDRPQLYDLSRDISQMKNLAEEQPQRVASMTNRLEELKRTTRTRGECA